MGQRITMIALALVWASCLAASPIGCCCPRRCGGCGTSECGYAEGAGQAACPHECDRYAARSNRHVPCCRTRRDPRIPGPRIVSTLPAPETEAPGYFQPVPTYPVFGPRSEEPDGIEPELQPLLPDGSPGMEDEPLPEPLRDSLSDEESGDEGVSNDEASDLKLAAPQQLVKHAGWKPAKKQSAQTDTPTRPCAKCTMTFRQPSSSQR
jgi:hypothetical protein